MDPSARLDTAAVFERIFDAYRRQARVLLPAAFLVYLGPSALQVVRGLTAQALALAATVIAAVLYQGVVLQAVRDIQDGVRDLSLRKLFASVSPVLAPLLWTAILVGAGVFLGLLAFVVPGLVVLTWWAVAAPAVVMERLTAPKAMARSRELVRGHGWPVFSVLIVTVLIVLIVGLVLVSLVRTVSDSDASLAVANLIANVLTAPIFALASAVLYLSLRALRGEAPLSAGPVTD